MLTWFGRGWGVLVFRTLWYHSAIPTVRSVATVATTRELYCEWAGRSRSTEAAEPSAARVRDRRFMPTEPTDSDVIQSVHWLEDQHRGDQKAIAALSQDLDRLTVTTRDQESRLMAIEDDIRQLSQGQARVGIVDSTVRDAHEQIRTLSERVDDLAGAIDHQRLMRTAEFDRDRKHLSDLATTVGETAREVQSVNARASSLADQQRQDRLLVAPIPDTLADFDRRLTTVQQRLQQMDDANRRLEGQLSAACRVIDEVRGLLASLQDTQKLTDVRLSRQQAEWQRQIDRVIESSEDTARPVGQLGVQFGQLRGEVQALQAAISETQRRTDDGVGAVQRVEMALSANREYASRIEGAVDAQRRRLEETIASLLRLDETVSLRSSELRDQAAKMDALLSDVQITRSEVQQIGQTTDLAHQGLEAVHETLLAQANTIEDHVRALTEKIDAAALRSDERRAEILALLVDHRRRQLQVAESDLADLTHRISVDEVTRDR